MAKRNPLRDHDQIKIPGFKGLYANGMDDAVPPGYFLDSLNTQFQTVEVETRDGFDRDFTLPNIRRFFIYKRLNETPRYLVLDTSGNLWDSLYSSPIGSNAAWKDFSALNYLNRAYITFHDRVSGIPGELLQVYEGEGPGTLRPAAGVAPVGFTLTPSLSTNSGNLGVGTYLISVAYETSTGFITAPGPATFAVIESPGGFKLNLADIPIGPAGTVARRILITKSIPPGMYAGNQYGYEFFFCPDGRIGNNTETTLNDINFFDEDLIDSADYLFDSRDTIPCGLGLTIYNNRMAVWGIPGFEHHVFLSAAIFIETFDQTAGILFLDPSDAISSIKNVVDHETSLFLQTQDRTYVTVDNGNNPNTWRCDPLDKAVGAEVFSVSKILDSRGTSVKRFFQGDKSGIYTYEGGGFQDPPFSDNIKDIWDRINKKEFSKVQLVDDAEAKLLYACIPLDNATECTHIVVGDYNGAFNRFGQLAGSMVRWNLWGFPWLVSSIAVDTNSDVETVFKQAGFEGHIYEQAKGSHLDDNIRIPSSVEFHLVSLGAKQVCHFGFLEGRIEGEGWLNIFISSTNKKRFKTIPRWTMQDDAEYYLQKPINFNATKMSVKLTCNLNAGEWFRIFDFSIDVRPLWAEIPRLLNV